MTGPHPHKNCDMLPADVAVAAWARVMSLSSSSSLNGSLGMNASGLGYPFADLADERTQSWPLVASPWSACLILALYLLLVHWGPRCMARWVWHTHCQHCSNVSSLLPSSSLSFSRKPLQLRLPLFCYNLLMATLNAHICLELYTAARALNYSAKCQPCRVSYDPNELRVSSHELNVSRCIIKQRESAFSLPAPSGGSTSQRFWNSPTRVSLYCARSGRN